MLATKEILEHKLQRLRWKLNIIQIAGIMGFIILGISLLYAGGVVEPVRDTSSWTDVAGVIVAIIGLLIMGLGLLHKIRKARDTEDLDL